jgi:predicted AAA+ superfamily ATPase
MKNKIYKRKVVDDIINYLKTDNVVVLHGARQVGKTHIMYWLKEYLENNGNSTCYIDLEDSRMTKIFYIHGSYRLKHGGYQRNFRSMERFSSIPFQSSFNISVRYSIRPQ